MLPKLSEDSSKLEKFEEDVQLIKKWLIKQPHLPSNIADQIIRRFVYCCDHSLEKTKQLLDLCFTIRSQAPEIFSDRDPMSVGIQKTFAITDMVPLPNMTAENYKLSIYRLSDTDPDKFNFADALKTFLCVVDVRLLTDKDLANGEISIFDMKGFTLRHLSKFTLLLVKKYMVYIQEAHPVKLRGIHLLNVPPYLNKVMAVIRPFLKSEVAALLRFHLPNSTTLYDYIPKDLLPEDYGGNLENLSVYKKEWMKRVESCREYFLEENRWTVDETKRPIENQNGKQLFGIQGSFRSLSID